MKNLLIRVCLILLLLMGVGVLAFYFSKRIRVNLLKKRIERMKTEDKVLMGLMKKSQIERFKKNKISGLVYGVRMKKYKERINKIKQELPFLEARLVKG